MIIDPHLTLAKHNGALVLMLYQADEFVVLSLKCYFIAL